MAEQPKAAWQGYITIGRLAIPIKLYSASRTIVPKFKLLHEADGSPIERITRCAHEQKEIPLSETIRAVETEAGKYITFTDNELTKAYGSAIKTADVKQFANPGDIPPVLYDKPYYIVPTRGGERAYSTLRDVLREHTKNAIVQIVLRAREHVAALGVHGDLLMMYRLRYAAELLPRASIKTPALPKPNPTEKDALSSVIERFSAPFFAEDYHDEYSEGVRELIDRKAKGLPMPRRESAAPHATPENSIIDVLQATLQNPQQLKTTS